MKAKLRDMSLEPLRIRNSDILALEPNKVYLVDPHMVLPQDPATECHIYYDVQPSSSQNCQEVNEGLQMLEILYNNQHDHPEFVDVNNLTDLVTSTEKDVKNPLYESDDDDVVFVAEYKHNDVKGVVNKNLEEDAPRRNPVRKARSNRSGREFQTEAYYVEDFAFLEQQDELEEMNRKMNSYIKKQQQQAVETYKPWPINVHERPEFNEQTKKLERFDYTIRKIKETIPKKKPKLVNIPKPAKKKRYFLRRKRIPKIAVEQKMHVKELGILVETTFELVKGFLKDSEDCKKRIPKSVNNNNNNVIDFEKEKLILLKNQALLNSIVNNVDKCKISESFINSSKG